jgi:hypothetical protein
MGKNPSCGDGRHTSHTGRVCRENCCSEIRRVATVGVRPILVVSVVKMVVPNLVVWRRTDTSHIGRVGREN